MSTSTVDVGAGLPVVLGASAPRCLLIQCQEPFWAGVLVTFRCFSMEALSVTGTSKRDDHRHADADGLAVERRDRRVGLLVEGQSLGAEPAAVALLGAPSSAVAPASRRTPCRARAGRRRPRCRLVGDSSPATMPAFGRSPDLVEGAGVGRTATSLVDRRRRARGDVACVTLTGTAARARRSASASGRVADDRPVRRRRQRDCRRRPPARRPARAATVATPRDGPAYGHGQTPVRA